MSLSHFSQLSFQCALLHVPVSVFALLIFCQLFNLTCLKLVLLVKDCSVFLPLFFLVVEVFGVALH